MHCLFALRACDEVQGTFALTIEGRGFEAKVSAGIGESFLDSECVSCGACIQACPTATLMEKSIIDNGQPDHSVLTTCAYCGVGCSFKVDMKGDQVVCMTPHKDGQANHGHSCVKGRFAWGYSTHKERVLKPMVRESINESEIMDEIATLTPTFGGVSFKFLDEVGSVQWPCNDSAPMGTPIMHVDHFVRGKGLFIETDYVPTEERTNRKFPLLLTTGRTLTQYNVGAQTRRTPNVVWYKEDLLEIHPHDAETRGINEGDRVSLASRKGDITLSAIITEKVQPGVVYTTFHDPETGANVVTTEYSDWATDCPEYKVTAVQVAPAVHRSKWQQKFDQRASEQGKILETT